MTRRIVIFILIACWSVLIAGGGAAFVATRSLMLDALDGRLHASAESAPDVGGTPGRRDATWQQAGDRYVIQNELGQTIAREPRTTPPARLRVVDRRFAELAGGERVRTLVLDGTDANGKRVRVVYSGTAQRFDNAVARLAYSLVMTGVLAGLTAALAAVIAARAALRPLRRTADAIGEIDDRRLDRRIDAADLPPELAPVAARLNDMLARLEQSLAQRRRFVAAAAHELRTPVAALATTLEVAARRPRDAAALTATLARCLTDVRHLRALVEALMRQARSEQPAAPTSAGPVDVLPVLRQAVHVASQLGQTRDVTVTADLPDELTLIADAGRVESVVTNLLANAVEYNRDGGAVRLTCRTLGPIGDVEIAVSDTGPGVPPEVLPNVFEPFVRGQTAGAPAASGDVHMGLGLALVRSHVTALGGACMVESEPGKGATFRVTLPAKLVARQEPVRTAVVAGPVAEVAG